MDPIYTPDNCTPAFQLRWTLALFPTGPLPPGDEWLLPLKEAVERDGIRILEAHRRSPSCWQFLLSTQPRVAPPDIVKSVKGRAVHVLRQFVPISFRRNFQLLSVGEARREVVESYVANQLRHHQMADERTQRLLDEFQFSFPEVDLSQPENSAHGQYAYNLHLVFVHQDRGADIRREYLETTRDMIFRVAKKKAYRLSRLALLADHVHLTLRPGYTESPQSVALSTMNNLAYAHGGKWVLAFSYYAGTIGEYDLGAIRRS